MQGDIDIKSFYGALRGSSSITFPWKSIWFVKALRRVIFCLGSHMGEGSHNGPEKRLHYNGLVICRCNGRVDHLLLHCGEVFQLWSFALRYFGVLWVLPKRVIYLLASWRNWLGKHSSNFWNLVPHGLFGGREIIAYLKIWCFLGILALFATTLFDWSRVWGFTSMKSILLFLDSLSSCT